MDPIRSNNSFNILPNFKNRILPDTISDPTRPEKPGIRTYGKFIGRLLEILGFAVRLETAGKTWFVNINSLNEWKTREKGAFRINPSIDDIDTIIDTIKNPAKPIMSRQKTKKEIRERTHEETAPTPPQPVKTNPVNENPRATLRTDFANAIDLTMGSHIRPQQKIVLMNLFDIASQSGNPKAALARLIDSKINQADGWGAEKAAHIRKNLLPLMRGNIAPQDAQSVKATPQNPLRTQIQQIAQRDKLVCFYKTGPTEFLGNFANCNLKIWGNQFRCSEAAFQWQKYVKAGINDARMNEFFTADGEQAFQLNRYLGNKYPNVFPPNWKNGVRDQVMWEVLNAKFQQNPNFKQLLDDTKGAYLLEHNQAPRDDYWSDNSNGTGKNMLGKMLTAIRDGKPQPPVNDNSDDLRNYVQFANRITYNIF